MGYFNLFLFSLKQNVKYVMSECKNAINFCYCKKKIGNKKEKRHIIYKITNKLANFLFSITKLYDITPGG